MEALCDSGVTVFKHGVNGCDKDFQVD